MKFWLYSPERVVVITTRVFSYRYDIAPRSELLQIEQEQMKELSSKYSPRFCGA